MQGDDSQRVASSSTEVRGSGASVDATSGVGATQVLTWLGEGKVPIALITVVVMLASFGLASLMPKIYTAHATLLAPQSQQQSSMSALASLGGLAGFGGGTAPKTSDDLYVALLRSDSLVRLLDERFKLKERYSVETFEALRRTVPGKVRVQADKKSGLITVDVDDEDPKFAADLANAHGSEVAKLLDRLAVSDAQLRRVFFDKQLKDTKENLIKAEQSLREVQEKSGLIVLDKQAEALFTGAAQLRSLISDREVQLKVLRTSATGQNPDVVRLTSEVQALRNELARMETTQNATSGSAVDMPVGKLPAAGIELVRARREVKLQESLLEAMIRQFETAKLDEAKEGASLQRVDVALPPDYKSKPSRLAISLACTLLALFATSAFVVSRRYLQWSRQASPQDAEARAAIARAWSWRG